MCGCDLATEGHAVYCVPNPDPKDSHSMTNDALIQMGRELSDIRFMRGFAIERSLADVMAQGRAWSRFEAALRDHPDPHAVRAAKQAEIDQMFAWERFHHARARQLREFRQ